MSDDEILDRLEQLLDTQRKPASRRGLHEVGFEAPLWENLTGPNWLAMVVYDRGRFWIEQGGHGRRLKYDLRSLHGLVVCLFAAAAFFVFGAMNAGLSGGVSYAAFGFGWLYGMNMVLAWFRVPRAIRKAVAGK